MHARSALFDLYGDHLRRRGGRAPVSALIKLLAPLGISPAAVRTAISRMVQQDWLTPVSTTQGPGYAATEKARERLDEAAARIYRTGSPDWDGRWFALVLDPIPERRRRDRVRNQLRFLGFAPLSENIWLAPRRPAELDRLLTEEGLAILELTDVSIEDTAQVLAAFENRQLGVAYDAWLRAATALVTAPPITDEHAFAIRSELVHGWRKFLFTDPALPAELLPADWVGHRAAAFFDEHATRLLPATDRFIDVCIGGSADAPGPTGETS